MKRRPRRWTRNKNRSSSWTPRSRFSHVLFALLYFSIFGFSIFRLQSVSFETGALLISMRWRFLFCVFYERSEFLCSDDELCTRPQEEDIESGDFRAATWLSLSFDFWPRSSGCFPRFELRNHWTGNCYKFLMRFTMCVFGALMISILFRFPAARGIWFWAGCLSASISVSSSARATRHSTWPRGQRGYKFIQGSVAVFWIPIQHMRNQ